jgi:hypothetical protein
VQIILQKCTLWHNPSLSNAVPCTAAELQVINPVLTPKYQTVPKSCITALSQVLSQPAGVTVPTSAIKSLLSSPHAASPLPLPSDSAACSRVTSARHAGRPAHCASANQNARLPLELQGISRGLGVRAL